jgi:competence protein ComEA
MIAGGVATLFQLHPWAKGPIEIILSEEISPISDTIEIYIDGAVVRPRWYPVHEYSTINDIILAAGGLTDGADTSEIKLYIPTQGEANESQKISINRADTWLLDALPGIGPTSAQKIADYREANGPFVTIYELLLVPGIGESTFDNIQYMITVE